VAFLEDEGNGHGTRRGIAVAARTHLGERVAVLANLFCQGIDGLFDHVAIIDFTGGETHEREQRSAINVRQMRVHIDRGDRILNPFLDRDRDDIAALFRVELGVGTNDMKIGIAILEIEPADTF